ncbi:GMC oxidoreductase [compost metagenome]
MGTTRMAASPEFGVVDANCKVFGTENLYVAGSSIFATGGASNPTMPLLQFAVRLAEHLNDKMKSVTSAVA